MSVPIETTPRFATGVPALDRVLHGGLPRCSLILVEGAPGSGKTTIAIQFLIQAVRAGESCLLATSAESPQQLRSIAASHGWNLDGINITGLSEPPSGGDTELDYTLFPEAEVEIGETFDHLFSEVERFKPKLLVLDTISSLRVVAPTPAFHRRQLKRIRDFMAARDCTTVMLDEASMTEKDLRSQTLSDGIIELRQKQSSYGADRRALRVIKLRGCSYVSGSHDVTIAAGGLTVHPRLVAQSFPGLVGAPALGSGNAEVDALVGGGLPRGSNTLIAGPAGVGKSTITNEPRASQTKVLVVDDDHLVGKLTGELIASFGMEVRVVPGGAEALEVIPNFQPRIVFVDLGMPGMDGYETVQRIRQLPGGDSLFIAALSGWGQTEDFERSAQAGFDRHFVKPIKISELENLFASESPT